MDFAASFDFGAEQGPGFGESEPFPLERGSAPQRNGEDLSRRFEKVLSADREICQQIDEEMAGLEQELARIEDATLKVEQQCMQDSKAKDYMVEEAQQLEHKVAEAQRRLVELRDDGRALNLESLSLRKDRNHLVEELGFLQRSLDDEMHTLQSLQQMNASFQAFHADMEANTELLLHQRKELIGQVSKERELSRQDARQNNELRNLLERRRREQAALVSGHIGHKEPLTPPDSAAQANPSGTPSPRAAVISNAHTWASFLSQPGASEKDKATTR
eukprot:s8955_g3.t1